MVFLWKSNKPKEGSLGLAICKKKKQKYDHRIAGNDHTTSVIALRAVLGTQVLQQFVTVFECPLIASSCSRCCRFDLVSICNYIVGLTSESGSWRVRSCTIWQFLSCVAKTKHWLEQQQYFCVWVQPGSFYCVSLGRRPRRSNLN